MPFEIRNKDGDKLTLVQLNNEAGILWKIPKAERICHIVEKEFVYPPNIQGNVPVAYSWYWIIGDAIERALPTYPEWSDVKKALMDDQLCHLYDHKFDQFRDEVIRGLNYLQPYFQLIDYWRSKRRIPIKLKKEE